MLEQISIQALLITLVILILISAFFSASETGIYALNRYRLHHTAKTNPAAARIAKLLSRPDRLFGVILIGNNAINIFASSIATIIGLRLYGDLGVLIATIIVTFAILIFAEITPKTLAAIKPETIAFLVAKPLQITLRILYPIVWICNFISNNLLRLFGVKKIHIQKLESLNTEELRTLLDEAADKISQQHQSMLLGILDLEKATIDEIMIPRSEVIGWDLNLEPTKFEEQVNNIQHTLIPIYEDHIDNIKGVLHIRDLSKYISLSEKITPEIISKLMRTPYFIPQGTSLYSQLLKFRNNKERLGCVVNEYGEFIGIVTLADILQEIVGEFEQETLPIYQEITPSNDGSYLIDGAISLRELNRKFGWDFPVTRVKTLSGMIIEYLENIPKPGTCILVDNHPIEVIKVLENKVKIAKIYPKLNKQ